MIYLSTSKTSGLLRISIVILCAWYTLAQPSLVAAASPSPSPKASASPSSSPKIKTSPSPSPSPSPISSQSPETTTQKLKDRIERIVEEKRDQVKGVLDELQNQRQGLVGEVVRVSSESLTVKTNRTTIIIPINDSLSIVKKKQPIAVDAIVVGEWVVVIGQKRDDDFVPEHIVVVGNSLRPTNRVITLGTVKSLTKTQIEVTPRNGSTTETFTLGKGTVYLNATGTSLPQKDLTTDMSVLVVGTSGETATAAKIVKVLGVTNAQ